MTAAGLAELGYGFEEPATASQQVFRCVLEAMARPGRLQRMGAAALTGIEGHGIGRGLCAVLLTLLDGETTLCIGSSLPRRAIEPYLRFHTGIRIAERMADADFAVIGAAQACPELLNTLRCGSDEAPQRGATLIVEVAALASAFPSTPTLRLRGPGIESEQGLAVAGIGADFWQARIAMQADFPRGVDLLLCCGDELAAIPRSTRIELEA